MIRDSAAIRMLSSVLSVTALAGACMTPANAQWTVVNLHPAGATQSFAYGVQGGQQVGNSFFVDGGPQVPHASLWTGSAASWVDLNPAGAGYSQAYGVDGGRQVGYAHVGGASRASLWSGTAASWVDLHPVGAIYSEAFGVDDSQQVGRATVVGGPLHAASLWSGSAASWVDLHPYEATYSEASGVDGGQQAGWAYYRAVYRASLWWGTAASWVDLNPYEATESAAYGVDGGQQVGYAIVGGVPRASLWTGTADSWVDLNPAGATRSYAHGVDGSQQVGNVYVGGVNHASLWSGTAASWVDLHSFLPPRFTDSIARGIWHDGNFTYVVGYGYNGTTDRYEALMWVASSGGGITLTVDGTCPGGGPITISWEGATPRGRIALLFGRREGNVVIPTGNECAGTSLGLRGGVRVILEGTTGASGSATISGDARPGACGGYMQLLDITTCGTSNVVMVN